MQPRALTPYLILLALIFTSLACTLERGDGQAAETEIDLPTPAPTEAPTLAPDEPTPEPPGQPSQTYPIVIRSAGRKTQYSTSTQRECTADASASLMIQASGTAELTTTGPEFADSYNCAKPMDVTYIIQGAADPASQTVVFQSCNYGAFTADGTIFYSGGKLAGEVTCMSLSGDTMKLIITP
jgi:hypothetical protein